MADATYHSTTNNTHAQVTWDYRGATNGLVGSGATTTEKLAGFGSAAILTIIILGADALRLNPVAATWWQIAILAFFACDIAGGAVANMLNSCKRFYHSPPRPHEGAMLRMLKNAKVFTAIHVHPILIALALGGSVTNAAIWYVLLQVSVWAVLAAPLYMRRGLGTFFVLLAILGDQLLIPLGTGLEWVIPALFIKMVIGHAVQEEPYAAPEQMAAAAQR